MAKADDALSEFLADVPTAATEESISQETKFKQCLDCCMDIPAEAKKCGHCGEWQDKARRQVRAIREYNNAYAEQKKSPWLAFVLSLLLVGAGHVYAGRPGQGVMWFVVTLFFAAGYFPIGLVLFVCAAVSAYQTAQASG